MDTINTLTTRRFLDAVAEAIATIRLNTLDAVAVSPVLVVDENYSAVVDENGDPVISEV